MPGIEFIIKPGGGVIMKPTGYTGDTCHEATKPYEDRLNGKKTTEPTEEAHQVRQQDKRKAHQ